MKTHPHWFIRARLKTRQLLLLSALAEEGNIHGAARSMFMTQPAASKLLKELEDVLAVPLFDRLPRGMRATVYGESMIRHARMVLANLGQAYEEVSALKAGLGGQVRVGTITTPGLSLLPMAISRLKHGHPNLRVQEQVGSSPELMTALRQGHLDMVIARPTVLQEGEQRLYRYTALSDEPVCAVVRPGHALLAQTQLQLHDVANCAWILPPSGSVLRQRLDQMFQQADLAPPSDLIETSSMLFVTRMLGQSDAIAVLSEEVSDFYAQYGLTARLSLTLPCSMDAFGLVTLRDQLPSPGARVLMRALAQSAHPLYGRTLEHEWLER